MADSMDRALHTVGYVMELMLNSTPEPGAGERAPSPIPVLLDGLYNARGKHPQDFAARRLLAEGLASVFVADYPDVASSEVRTALVEFFVTVSAENDHAPLCGTPKARLVEGIRDILTGGNAVGQLQSYAEQLQDRLRPETPLSAADNYPFPQEADGTESLW